MASLPPQASQRRLSPTEPSSVAAISDHEVVHDVAQSQSRSESTNKEHTKSLIVNLPLRNASDAPAAAPKPEPRHCWICLQDEDEEGSDNSAWRSPCPCNLQAHEECMLEWITDLEAPNSRKGGLSGRVLCPQCKAEIQVERPRDIVVSTVDLLNMAGRALILPTGLGAVLGCLFSGSLAYGRTAVWLVCGSDYADELIRRHSHEVSVIQGLVGDRMYRTMLNVLEFTDPFMPTSASLSLEMFVSLPLIAPALILSRTRLADYLFAVLPVPLFALPLALSSEPRSIRHWPPSPDLAIAVLPYIRTAYNEIYRIVFAELEKQWDQAVLRKPREGETVEQVAQGQNGHNGEGGIVGLPMGANLEFVLEVGIGGEDPAPAAEQQPPADPNAAVQPEPNANPPNDDAEAGQQQQPNGAPVPQPGDEMQLAGRDFYPLNVGSTIMGALFFPAISSLMGDLLKHTLPKKWVMKSVLVTKSLPATGLLQEKWGRSIVGGCLFVVLKDALALYVKWKRARDQVKRRVLDYRAS